MYRQMLFIKYLYSIMKRSKKQVRMIFFAF